MSADLQLSDPLDSDLQTVLSGFQNPAFLLSATGQIEWLNQSALDALKSARGIAQGPDGRLLLKHSPDNDKFAHLVKQLENLPLRGMAKNPSTMRFFVAGELMEPNLINITSLSGPFCQSEKQLGSQLDCSRRILMTIKYRADFPVTSEEELSHVFGLTKAEARIVDALVSGQSVRQMAGKFEVSVHTVRSQLKSVFAKTDTSSQSDLVRLIMSSPLEISSRSRSDEDWI